MKNHDPHIRWMIRRDMPTVHRIEAACFAYPWSDDDFIKCLRQRNCIGKVVERGDKVIAFNIYELHHKRLHLLTLAVDPDFQRQGVGSLMVNYLLKKLSYQCRVRMTLEIRESNLPAQLFFRAMGFRALSVMRGFYDDSDDDAYVFQYRLPASKTVDAVSE